MKKNKAFFFLRTDYPLWQIGPQMATRRLTAQDIKTFSDFLHVLYIGPSRFGGARNDTTGAISHITLIRDDGSRFEIPVAPGQEFDVLIF
jgi:hypothetical protein